MKLLLALPVLALAHVGLADFFIFRVDATASDGSVDFGYQIADVEKPTCEELKAPWYGLKQDVGDKTLGVSCGGKGCTAGQVRHRHLSQYSEFT
jgi:hypothetical protein